MNLYDQFIQWAGSLNAQQVADWLRHLEWNRLVPEITGKCLGFLLGFGASWFLLFRRHLKALDRLRRGDSDDVLFQAHFLAPVPGTDKYVLLFRNLMPSTTVNDLYDNPAARKIVRELADITTLRKPVLRTEGVHGYEVLNDAFNHISGHLAITPFPRETWLFAMTCEDRQVVRRKCVRCFLVRPAELERFANWRWCRDNVVCEQPWHWYRIVALHQLATVWQEEEKAAQNPSPKTQGMPLVDKHATHRRIRPMSVGIFTNEKPVGTPAEIHWPAQEWELKKLGLDLNAEPVPGGGEWIYE